MLTRLLAFSFFMFISGCFEDCREHAKLDVEKVSACYYHNNGGYIVVAGEVGATDPYLTVMAHTSFFARTQTTESVSNSDGSFSFIIEGSEDDAVSVYAYPVCEDTDVAGAGASVLVSVRTDCE